VRSLADMVATATPDGKTAAAKCLRRLGLSGLSNWSAHFIQLIAEDIIR
jgi:hypothetical protein